MCHQLEHIASERGLASPVVRGSPTGVAAYNMIGKTIHSLFRLPVKKDDYATLSAQARKTLQEAWNHVKYLILDEKSMVSLKLFSWVDRRCREIWPANDDIPFGGLNIVIVGDFCQLPPVGGKALYNDDRQNATVDVLNAQRLYGMFNRTITLTQVMRQQGTDAEAVAFRTALGNLGMNQVTKKDWKLLTSRVQARVGDISAWKDALRIYQTRELVNEYNHRRMRDLMDIGMNEGAVVVLEVSHTGFGAKDASTDDAERLKRSLPVAIGSRVMLQKNIWTEWALFNGAVGIVRDVIWAPGVENPCKEAPLAILVNFDHYDRPESMLDPVTGRRLVPIFRSKRDWIKGAVTLTRTQFPLTEAHAITIHKSQGKQAPLILFLSA
jgi:ATP-dependent DNA helicase PIF1